jgi:L-ascorbate metabolism protein UlaG (beta-lactamase superfamily)
MDKRYEKSPNFKDGKFINAEPLNMGNFFKITWKYMFSKSEKSVPTKPIPIENINQKNFFEPPSEAIKFYWLGHSSIILEMDKKRIIFDPVFSKRASPVQWAGPKRFHPTPLELTDLPKIDAVLISHDHYDHLDESFIKYAKDRDLEFIVPLAIGKYLKDWGVKEEKITELDWWGEFNLDGLKIISVPARHFSSRGLFDRDETQWCSFVVVGKSQKVYFSGDTGFTKYFNEISSKFAPFDLTFIKIGAYSKLWANVHLNPEEAVETHRILKGKVMVPIHWATFDLALHSWYEPIDRLIKAAGNENKILIPRIGEGVSIGSEHKSNFWWESVKE